MNLRVKVIFNSTGKETITNLDFASGVYNLILAINSGEEDDSFRERIRKGDTVWTPSHTFSAIGILDTRKIVVDMQSVTTIVAIDFDGVMTKEPNLIVNGKKKKLVLDKGFLKFYKEMKRLNVQLILWTCRSGQLLLEAVKFLNKQGIEFDAINDNVPTIKKLFNINCRKIFAHMYVDDLNVDGFKGFEYVGRKVKELVKSRS